MKATGEQLKSLLTSAKEECGGHLHVLAALPHVENP
jgi:hypothetical protein